MNFGAIVEGHGEVKAVPALIRRIAAQVDPALVVNVLPPMRVPRGRIAREPELRRSVELVARKAGAGAPILILLDADDDAACQMGPTLLAWATAARSDRQISVVLANREYEAWFLAAAASLAGHRGLSPSLAGVSEPELEKNPKRWLDDRMPNGYSETLDQPALTAVMSLEEARRAASFDKMIRDVARLLAPRSESFLPTK
jgi:hypothetical protein